MTDDDPARTPPPGTVTVFTTTWCGYCRRLTAQLDDAGVPYRTVDVEEHPDAAALVERVNGGDRTVPTVLFPDGSAATNPSARVVAERLSAAGATPSTPPTPPAPSAEPAEPRTSPR